MEIEESMINYTNISQVIRTLVHPPKRYIYISFKGPIKYAASDPGTKLRGSGAIGLCKVWQIGLYNTTESTNHLFVFDLFHFESNCH